ncbi:transmembrane protein 109 [Thalassophryne amazonica]|uniref:transmembrane protein 109 n=1 Tax=Thalassophryne amazonica TaxID=390379 RepID=UPI001471CAFB|nr:transmembrane protein 109 [Thalassophryne amazonica]
MFSTLERAGSSCPNLLFGLSLSLFCVSGEKVPEQPSGVIHELRTLLTEVAADGRAYLDRLAGEQTVLSVQKAFAQVVGVVAAGVASGLNVLSQYVTHFLQTAGIQVSLPVDRVTADGVIFVTQWVFVALIGYWLISLVFQLVASALREVLWLVKVGAALFCFGLILRDHDAGTVTMAIRLGVLVCVCVLLGVGSRGGGAVADKTAHLEDEVRILQRRLREMEKRRRMEE